jgi:hypothetical protein
MNPNERQSNSPNAQNNSFNFSNLNMPSTSGLQFNNSFSLQSNGISDGTKVITLSLDTDDESSDVENNEQIDNRIEDRIEAKKEVRF